MTQLEVIAQASRQLGVPKETVKKSLRVILRVIAEALAHGEDVKLKGFGTFGVRARRPSQRSHLKTRQLIPVASKVMPRFKPSKSLRKRMTDNLAVVQLPSGRWAVRPRKP